jgi:hypothetical protein
MSGQETSESQIMISVREGRWDKGGNCKSRELYFGVWKIWIFKKWDRETWIGLMWLRIWMYVRRL